jgi:hypothetical protein
MYTFNSTLKSINIFLNIFITSMSYRCSAQAERRLSKLSTSIHTLTTSVRTLTSSRKTCSTGFYFILIKNSEIFPIFQINFTSRLLHSVNPLDPSTLNVKNMTCC